MGEKASWIGLEIEDREELEKLCPLNEFRVLSGSDLPGFVPDGFKAKCDHVVVAASGSSDGIAYWMMNYNRRDMKARAYDHEPFGLVFSGSVLHPSGVFVHHADYEGRTTQIPAGFISQFSSGKIPSTIDLDELPDDDYGPFAELEGGAQARAFEKIKARLAGAFGDE